MSIEAMKLALEAIEYLMSGSYRSGLRGEWDRVGVPKDKALDMGLEAITTLHAAPEPVVAPHPYWVETWSPSECDRLAAMWTECVDLTAPGDKSDYIPQWKVVMALMQNEIKRLRSHPSDDVPDDVRHIVGWWLCNEANPQDGSPWTTYPSQRVLDHMKVVSGEKHTVMRLVAIDAAKELK